MIRFLDKEVACIGLEQYNRDELLQYFLKEGENNVVLVYDRAEYYGMATYQSVLGRKGENGILSEKYRMKPDEDMFLALREILKRESENIVYLPVFNEDMQLLYFAYEYRMDMNQMEDEIFSFMEQETERLFIKELYPEIKKVCIYDFNEFAYRFYRALKARRFPVEVFGEKWELFYPQIYKSDRIQFGGAICDEIMNVYAEGTHTVPQKRRITQAGSQIGEAWEFLWNIVTANTLSQVIKLKEYLREKKVTAFTMLFPDLEELDDYSVDEYYRHMQRIAPYSVAERLSLRDMTQINRCWCEKAESSRDDKIKKLQERERKSAWENAIFIEDKSVEYKDYGSGEHILYVIGPCIVRGLYVEEEDSFGNYLYKEIQNYSSNYLVRCIAIKRGAITLLEKAVKSLTLREKDIVILVDHNRSYKDDVGAKIQGYPGDIDVKGMLKRRQDDWFWDWPIHTNQRGNAEIAKILIKEYLAEYLGDDTAFDGDFQILQAGGRFLPEIAEEEILQYIRKTKANDADAALHTGAIVMNCNPMTRGHLYLIEQALQRVDYLYIFLVEEDKSEFAFTDRFKMVQAVTQKYTNVKVAPSGRFVLSCETLPIYFEKAEKQEELLDATWDLKIFGNKIAPALGINTRLVGEEPKDKITRQYNEAMKKMLPHYGIQLVEIPRMKLDHEIVSASTVRRYLAEGKMSKVKQMVPEEVYRYLVNMRK